MITWNVYFLLPTTVRSHEREIRVFLFQVLFNAFFVTWFKPFGYLIMCHKDVYWSLNYIYLWLFLKNHALPHPVLHNCYGRLTHQLILCLISGVPYLRCQGGGGLLLKLWECFSVLTKLNWIPLSTSALLSLNCCELYIKCINHRSQRPGEPLRGGAFVPLRRVFLVTHGIKSMTGHKEAGDIPPSWDHSHRRHFERCL